MTKFSDIIKAKLSDKTNMPDWYYERLEACKSCPLYSLNYRPDTIPEKVRYASLSAANTGKPFCWTCGCEVEAKASLPGAECPGTPKRWQKQREGEITIADQEEYDITNLSTDKVAMSYKRSEFLLEYGTIDYMSDTKVTLLITPKTEEDFINLKPTSTCGCTVPNILREGRNLKMNIEYDSKRVGEFSKLVTLEYTTSRRQQIQIRIKGTVKRD